jgi:tetratricopeptide (TPR) repeat protein
MRYYLSFLYLFCGSMLFAQDPNLANQYYQNGEYEKAGSLFEKLYQTNETSDYYFEKYVDCLANLQQYEKCEGILNKQIKKRPKEVHFFVALGGLFEKQNKEEQAKECYQKAIDKLGTDRYNITKLANTFTNSGKYQYAIATYEKGGELIKDKFAFSYYLGDLYRNKGDNAPKMIENYLNSLENNPTYLNTLKTVFQRYLTESEFGELQTQLYSKIQDKPNNTDFVELLTWVFIQRKDYKNAFRQAKALDRQLDETGARIYQIAEIAANDHDYAAAIEGFDYIVAEKGATGGYYMEAKRQSLDCRRKKIVENKDYTDADLRTLETEYEKFLTENGRSKVTANIIVELADLEGFYIKDVPKAIGLLKELIDYPGLDRNTVAKSKISLGDFYLMTGEVWESTLLYSQVDKEFKDDPMGHEARFRNARLSYYNGDFTWAQAQFDVLKASTSKLIANDALDLSVFIMDNSGLDTTTAPLKLYADADFFVFQNRFDSAYIKLDTLNARFPKHTLEDDVYWLEGQVSLKKREWTKAAGLFEKIIADFKDGIRADNALFALADLYEHQLNDPKKAQGLYEKMFTEFSGSTFAVEARKRFRKLRGDKLEN